jgi:hypothetical protein
MTFEECQRRYLNVGYNRRTAAMRTMEFAATQPTLTGAEASPRLDRIQPILFPVRRVREHPALALRGRCASARVDAPASRERRASLYAAATQSSRSADVKPIISQPRSAQR